MASKKSFSTPTTVKPYVTNDSSKAFRHFSPLAEALLEEELLKPNISPELARTNVERAIAAIASHHDRIRDELPKEPLHELLELPALALAFVHASQLVEDAPSKNIQGDLATLHQKRHLALNQLEILAALGMFPAETMATLRAGTGALDAVRDAIAAVDAFKNNEATFKGKHPFSVAWLDELLALANRLSEKLTPSEAKRVSPLRSGTVLRDQLFTLLKTRYERLRRVGVLLFGESGVEKQVPPLGARKTARKKKEAKSV